MAKKKYEMPTGVGADPYDVAEETKKPVQKATPAGIVNKILKKKY